MREVSREFSCLQRLCIFSVSVQCQEPAAFPLHADANRSCLLQRNTQSDKIRCEGVMHHLLPDMSWMPIFAWLESFATALLG